MEEAKVLKDSEIDIVLITCKKCGHPILAGGVHDLGLKDKREIAELVLEGHKSETYKLPDYRKLNITGWCNSKCTTPKNP